ncbi:hypothetical protein FRB96_008084 [Tulasnella sp. 330]|nr:hypothetical protein FRB96_008084 [Tulasnella sp. 330]
MLFPWNVYSPRKYVDLIWKADGKWANWDPSMLRPEVGDFGTISKETGVFEYDGSIYSDEFAEEYWSDKPRLREKFAPVKGSRETMIIIKSSSVRQLDLAANPEVTLASFAEASFKATWQFKRGRGALLFLTEPCSLSLPPNELLKKLVKVSALKDRYLVTSVTKCPGVGTGGELNGKWWSQKGTGVFKVGGAPGGEDAYTPLFSLKMIRKPLISSRRDSPPPIREGDDLWKDAEEPWGALGDDGDEEEIIADDDIPEW